MNTQAVRTFVAGFVTGYKVGKDGNVTFKVAGVRFLVPKESTCGKSARHHPRLLIIYDVEGKKKSNLHTVKNPSWRLIHETAEALRAHV